MNFESSQQIPSNGQQNQSFLGGLVQTIADDAINYGSHYLEQQVDQWAQNL